MSTKRRLAMVVAILAACTRLTFADPPPERIGFQGVLRDSGGAPVSTPTRMEFHLYDSEGCGAGTLLLSDEHTSVTPDDGLFNVALGGGTNVTAGAAAGIREAFRDHDEVWIEIEVGPELSSELLCPRIRIEAAAYAQNASSLGGRDASEYLDTSTTHQTKAGELTLNNQLNVVRPVGSTLANLANSDAIGGGIEILAVGAAGQFIPVIRGTEPSGTTGKGALHLTGVVDGDVGTAAVVINGTDGGSALSDRSILAVQTTSGITRMSVNGKGWLNVGLGTENVARRLRLATIFGNGFHEIIADNGFLEIDPAFSNPLHLGGDGEGVGIGVGNTNPSADLDVAGTTELNGDVDVTGSSDLTVGGRIGIGTTSPADQLELTGNLRLPPTTSTAGIIRSGGNRLMHSYGTNNFFAGTLAGNLSLTNERNTGVGGSALAGLTSGSQNTALGYAALTTNTSGYANVGVGKQALEQNTTGALNVAVGSDALPSNDTGAENIGIGWWALRDNTSGLGNVAVGLRALEGNVTGDDNTAIGTLARVGADGLTHATAIGSDAVVSASNSVILGHLSAKVGIGLNAPQYELDVVGQAHFSGGIASAAAHSQVDHPLDPANKYLKHAFVESPEMMNVYNGNATTDAAGLAVVALPEWFEAINEDFRYQLTAIGEPAQTTVIEEVRDNRFTIGTDVPHARVSWQVTGIRKDPWAEANRVAVEQDKKERDRGKYLHPELYGLDRTHSVSYFDPDSGASDSSDELERERRPEVPAVARAPRHDGGPATASGPVGAGSSDIRARSFRSSASDLAGLVPVAESVEPGDVLVIDGDRPGIMTLSRAMADTGVFGIVASDPGIVLGASGTDKADETVQPARVSDGSATEVPVTLSGIALCKVDAGYGAIRAGDLLTTSATPGHAMRSAEHLPGTIVGKALEPLDSGTSRIKVLVMLR